MGSIAKELCEPHHLIIVILVLVIALLVTGTGKGLGGIISAFLKKLVGGKTVEINIGGEAMGKKNDFPPECQACGLMVDPSKCIMHQSEHERSMRNEAQIAKIWAEYAKLRDETLAAQTKLREDMTAGFEKVNASIASSNTQILTALAGSRGDRKERP